MSDFTHIDWDDPEQVGQEKEHAFERYPHLGDCAAADGTRCPKCGSTDVDLKHDTAHFAHYVKARHCQACGCDYIQYVPQDGQHEEWKPVWHENLVSYGIEDYPWYIYFRPGTNVCLGLGPNLFPWE
jgi:hypothetical protein